MYDVYFFFFFKQKTAYEMRISDWSSDVCSSDLQHRTVGLRARMGLHIGKGAAEQRLGALDGQAFRHVHILAAAVIAPARSEERRVGKEGVGPCRTRGWPYHSEK